MNEGNIKRTLAADGSIREDAIVQRILLGEETGGVVIERLVLQEPKMVVIRKTTTNAALAAREAALYANVLPQLPAIYPQLLTYASSEEQDIASLVYEDEGAIDHSFDEQLAVELIGHMARWHAMPAAALLLGGERGPRPDYEELAAELIMTLGWGWVPAEDENVWGMEASLVKRVYDRAKQQPPVIKYVLSHGDLHAGSYGRSTAGTLIVTNWAHMHRNSPYWDLYHMLDWPSGSETAAQPIDDAAWERLLTAYWQQAGEGIVPAQQAAFMQEYCLFAAVFSFWALQELERQLAAEEAAERRQRLLQERGLAVAAFQRCAGRL